MHTDFLLGPFLQVDLLNLAMIRRLLAALFPPSAVKRLVGVDHLGNKYYESEKADGKKRRFLERSDDIRPEDYVHGMIPNQWEAWIRGRTDTPPTMMELLEREKMEKIIATRAAEVKIKDDNAQQKAYEDGLISRAVEKGTPSSTMKTKQLGHASAPVYGAEKYEKEPSTFGGDFKPGAWKPSGKQREHEAQIEEEDNFQPASWTPTKQKKS